MKSNEFDRCLNDLERSVPADLAEAASEIFWAACLIGIDQRLVKAVTALVKQPDLTTAGLMRAAGVTSGTATRARTGLRIVGRDKLPPAPSNAEPEPAPSADTSGEISPVVASPEPTPLAAVDAAIEGEILPPAPAMAGRANGHQRPPQPATRHLEIPTGNGCLQRATRLLLTELNDGPRPESELLGLAESDNIAPKQLLRVAEQLGVKVKRGEWRLPT